MEEILPRDIASELEINEREAAALKEALADREAAEVNSSLAAETRGLTPREMDARAATLAQKVSQAAFDLIVQHETGGRKYYEKVYGGTSGLAGRRIGSDHWVRLRSWLCERG